MQLIVYIGNILLNMESEGKAQNQASGLVYLLQSLGFIINTKKTIVEPTQAQEFVGFTINTMTMELSLLPVKIKKIWVESQKLLKARQTSAQSPLQINWQAECDQSGNLTSATVLQAPKYGPGGGSESGRPRLRDNPHSISR